MKTFHWIWMLMVVTEITWGSVAWAEIVPHTEDFPQSASHGPLVDQAMVPTYLKAAGIKKTRVAFTINEAPLTFQDAWLACMKWGMVLPTIEQLNLLKPHLNSLLSGLTYRDRGFVWSISTSGEENYPRKVISLDSNSTHLAKESAKGIALCVDSERVPEEVKYSQMLLDEMEQAYQIGLTKGKNAYFLAQSIDGEFRTLFPQTKAGRYIAQLRFTSRRNADPVHLKAKKAFEDDDSGPSLSGSIARSPLSRSW